MRVASTAKRLLKDDIFSWFTQKPIYEGRRIRERLIDFKSLTMKKLKNIIRRQYLNQP